MPCGSWHSEYRAPWLLGVARHKDATLCVQLGRVVARHVADGPAASAHSFKLDVASQGQPQTEVLQKVAAVRRRECRALLGAGDVVAVAQRQREVGARHNVVRVEVMLGKVGVAPKEPRAGGAPPVVPRRAHLVRARAERVEEREPRRRALGAGRRHVRRDALVGREAAGRRAGDVQRAQFLVRRQR
eukprot:1690629-Prymnesium_polylepis.1